jgi:hypothetical protein
MMNQDNLSGKDLLAFQAISAFVIEATKVAGKMQRSLQLYNRLIDKTSFSHVEAITKHINSFRNFCSENQEALQSQNIDKLKTHVIEYSPRVFINVRLLLMNSEENSEIIWQHLMTIGAIVFPQAKLKEVLAKKVQEEEERKSSSDEEAGAEDDFLANIMAKVENSVDPSSTNPADALSQMMSGGMMTDLMSSMTGGMQDGSLDLGKMMGSLQKMVGKLQDTEGAPPELKAMTGNLTKMLDNAKLQVDNTD